MGLRNADYRVSSIVVLCKDCGEDCGLYPARHKCTKDTRPKLPTLCSSTSDSSAWSSEDEKQPTQNPDHIRVATGKWSTRFKSTQINEGASVYYEKFAANLNNGNTTGKKLWGRVKENEKWKELIAKKEEKKPGRLWQRLIQATIPTLDPDYEAESDQEDWEGETHVSRILREHHQSKNEPLPSWLLEDGGDCDLYKPPQQQQSIQRSTTRTRRLWQAPIEGQETGRERERRALRENNNRLDKNSLLSRSQSERVLHDARFENDIYGSIAPRRTNTTARSNVSRVRPFQQVFL